MTNNEPPPYPGEPGPEGTDQPKPYTEGLPSYGSTEPPPEGSYPPPPPPPPGAPGGHHEPFSAPDAIGWGWRQFRANIGPILLAGLLFIGVTIAFSVVGGLVSGGGNPFDPEAASAGFTIAGTVVNIVSSIVSIIITAVISRAALDVVDGHGFDIVAAARKIDFVKVVIASIVVSIIVVVGFLLLVIPGIVLLFLTYFTTFFVVDDDAGSPFGAISDSVKLVAGNIGDALLLAILNILVIIAGVLALCVGLFVAYPITILASAYAYRKFRGQPVAA